MHKHIDKIVGVVSDGNSGFCIILTLTHKGEENQTLVCHTFIKELTYHNNDYMNIYQTNEQEKITQNALIPSRIGVLAPQVK